jgi:stringent starvation protein B
MNEIEFMEIYSTILKRKKAPVVNIDTTYGEVIVPREFIDSDGSLQICISPEAVRNLKIENDIVYCRVTFQREPFCLSFPLDNIIEFFEEDKDNNDDDY